MNSVANIIAAYATVERGWVNSRAVDSTPHDEIDQLAYSLYSLRGG
ncbi:MAG TPA: hypothetical protein VLV32_04485 [Burkholderiales bacterium]|nr:hypothetical protein [Burkholderiales bacterium]